MDQHYANEYYLLIKAWYKYTDTFDIYVWIFQNRNFLRRDHFPNTFPSPNFVYEFFFTKSSP